MAITGNSRHRDFIVSTADELEDQEPVTFTLAGVTRKNGETINWEESFACVPEAPSGVLDDMAASVRVDERGRRSFNAPSLLKFLIGVLEDDDVERFLDLVHDKYRVVKIEQLGEVFLYVQEEMIGRPTMPRSSSSRGASRSGRGSRAASARTTSGRPKR